QLSGGRGGEIQIPRRGRQVEPFRAGDAQIALLQDRHGLPERAHRSLARPTAILELDQGYRQPVRRDRRHRDLASCQHPDFGLRKRGAAGEQAGEEQCDVSRHPYYSRANPQQRPAGAETMTDLSDSASAFWRVIPADRDPAETREWLDAFESLVREEGAERATFILRKLLDEARARRVKLPPVFNTPYCNTISLAEQPQYPGNLEIEHRLMALVRWNALAMVVHANREHPELGGHIASYASAADLFEVGYNHFFRAGQSGDLVYFQPHSAPGVYARAFLEGRLTGEQLAHYRRETGGNGLTSYCHPYLMPQFWQFPTGSMGLGPITAVYQARFMRYLDNRGILPTSAGKLCAFAGNGEMDEPESLAGLSLAAREELDNLIFVVNCNLQRLDGPGRGNGSGRRGMGRL